MARNGTLCEVASSRYLAGMSPKADLFLAGALGLLALVALVAIAVLSGMGKPVPEILGHVVTGATTALAALARSLLVGNGAKEGAATDAR